MSVPILLHIGFLLLLHLLSPPASAESPACLAVYRAGGAPAVFQSPKCPRWTLVARPPPPSCHLAAHHGSRPSQEDRAVCAVDIRIPFLGRKGINEVSVSIVAVFDGHNGAEASDMASKLLLEYFMLHVYFLLDGIYSDVLGSNLMLDGEHDEMFEVMNVDERRSWRDTERFKFTFAAIHDDAFHMEILKKSLLRTVHDIDATFSKEASSKNLDSDSTATVVLITDGQILTANLGDSKALLCSENTRTAPQQKANAAIPTGLVQMDYFNQIVSKFNRMLVEAQYRGLGCFYLSENLNENMDYVVRAPKHCRKDEMHNSYQPLPGSLGSYHGGGNLDLFHDPKMCWHLGYHDGDKGYCTSPEVFAKFLGLLDSVPYSGSTSNSSESFGNKFPDFRYALRKKFDRGSYGEVWLGFHWNCSQETDALNGTHRYTSHFATSSLDPCEGNRGINTSSSTQKNFTDPYYNMFILKRIMVERGSAAYLSGLREKYFGETFLNASISVGGLQGAGSSTACSMEARADPSSFVQKSVLDVDEIDCCSDATDSSYKIFRTSGICSEEGIEHIARYVESFESKSKEIWLVFQNEGMSLSKLMYKAEEVPDEESNEQARNILILHPSSWWHWLRTTEAGKKEMQNLIWQLLLALKSCHDRNITHRDVKPENMIVCFEDEGTGRCAREVPNGEHEYHLRMRIIDFGSAIDEYTLKYLYGSGPTRSEQTYEYTPPEALLNASWFHGPKSVTLKYDMWSVGVVMLEMILGSPHVFQISGRTRALMDQHLEGWSDHTKELAYKLRSYMEMCILIPGISPQHHPSGTKDHHGVSPASWKCSEESFSHQVKSRDPLNLGFPNVWALRLVRQLLVWHPEDRISVDDALNHPYFQEHP